ncbi:MAG: acyltransferase, partial [Bifidobacteriaceae bacterium]|nr:acyltransferase [Bifidobacteriaceae bacterium]
MADQQRQGQRRLRRDIQALRALAVMMVLVYHLWGNFLGGAFVGVDIFFVISGFLITQHLISHPPTNCFDLVVFWGKRIRRLLPAAFTVIAVTLLFAWLFMPSTLRGNTASSAFGATLYFANWQLSAAAVDYLAATASPTPFQHFWSLAVEEQFYLIWPVIVGVAAGLGRRFGKPNILGLLMALVTAGSLAYCIHKTATDSAAAYFVTPGRVWELASGGLLAVGYPQIHRYMQSRWWLRRLAGGSGLVVMLASCWLIRSDANFPGVVAIWPVLGALLVIAAGPQSERFAKYSPIQFLGNASYSIYLWHYPVVVLLPHIIGHSLNTFTKLIAAVGIIGLAGLSKKYIEDRW